MPNDETGAGVGEQGATSASVRDEGASPHPAAATENATGPHPGQELTVQQERKPALSVGEGGYIVPADMMEAYRMAKGVVAARLAPDSYNNDPEKVMLGIMAAMEAGLPPLYGLRQIAIINGRPTIWGDAAMALVQSKNLIAKQEVHEITRAGAGEDDFEEAPFDPNVTELQHWPDWYGFEVKLWRRGQSEPYVGRFTVGDAKRANLWMNPRKVPWMTSPRRMLLIRGRAFPLRDGFADALAGLAIREEIEDIFGPEERVVDTGFLSDAPIAEVPPMPVENPEEETDA